MERKGKALEDVNESEKEILKVLESFNIWEIIKEKEVR